MGCIQPKRGIVTVGLVLACTVCSTSFAADKGESGSSKGGQSSGGGMQHSEQMHQMMSDGMKEMQGMSMSGDMDKDFAMMMRHHHQQGVRMAQMELEHGKDPKMKGMAKKILESQQREIKEFDQWMKQKGEK